jgi:hypothetical protein
MASSSASHADFETTNGALAEATGAMPIILELWTALLPEDKP